MNTTHSVLKRCVKCGVTAWYRPRERRCKQQKFGPRSYWCYGRLSAQRRKPLDKAEHIKKHRALAERELRTSASRVDAVLTKIKRLKTSLHKLEAKIRRAERKLAMTDEQILDVRKRAQHAAHIQKVRRRLLGKNTTEEKP